MEEILKLTEELSNAFGPSGYEDEVVDIIKKYVGEENCETDGINNLYIGLKDIDTSKPTVILDGHSDEVGFMVESVNPNGTLNFVQLGGWFVGTLSSSPVLIKTFGGKFVKGIMSSKPVHFMTSEERTRLPKMSEMTIDIGTSSYEETVSRGIDVGCPIVPDVEYYYDEVTEVVRAKALDNRLGCLASAVVYKNMQKIKDKLKVNVVAVMSAQEEVGCRGAQIAAQKIKGDYVIVFEAAPADDTFRSPAVAKGKLKSGAQFRVIDGTMVSNPRMIAHAKKVCTDNNLKYQIIAREGGGTDAAKYHLFGAYRPSLVIGVPTRYIHSHYSYAAASDILSMIEISEAIIKDLDADKIKKL